MNILIAKTLLQSWINENDFPLWEDNAQGNYDYLYHQAEKLADDEIISCLLTIKHLNAVYILANK